MNNVMKMVDTYTCTGCCICIAFCPHGNLSMKQGDLGFPVPYVNNNELCNGCNQCIKACPFSEEYEEYDE